MISSNEPRQTHRKRPQGAVAAGILRRALSRGALASASAGSMCYLNPHRCTRTLAQV